MRWHVEGQRRGLAHGLHDRRADREVGDEVAVHHVDVHEAGAAALGALRSRSARWPKSAERIEGARITTRALLTSRLTARARAHAMSGAAGPGAGRCRRARPGRCGSARPSTLRPAGRSASSTSSARLADQVGHHVVAAAGAAAHQQRRRRRRQCARSRRPAGAAPGSSPPPRRRSPPRRGPTGTCAWSSVSRAGPQALALDRRHVRRRGPRLTQTRTLRWLLSARARRRLLRHDAVGGHPAGRCACPRRAAAGRAGGRQRPASGTRLPIREGTTTSCDVSTTRMVGERAEARRSPGGPPPAGRT